MWLPLGLVEAALRVHCAAKECLNMRACDLQLVCRLLFSCPFEVRSGLKPLVGVSEAFRKRYAVFLLGGVRSALAFEDML